MYNFVISLSSATKRRTHIKNEFGKQLISFEFFDAVSINNQLEVYKEQLLPNIHHSQLTTGEKGCLLSHLALWQKCVNDNLPYIAIFEDDVLLSPNAHHFLNQDDWLTSRFDLNLPLLLRLETFLMPVEKEKTDIEPFNQYQFISLKSVHFGTAGYIISQPLAKLLLESFKSSEVENITAIDHWLFKNQYFINNLFKVYQLSPAICVQELQYSKEHSQLKSSIQFEREEKDRTSKPKLTIYQKLIRELKKGIFYSKRKKQKKLEAEENKHLIIPYQ